MKRTVKSGAGKTGSTSERRTAISADAAGERGFDIGASTTPHADDLVGVGTTLFAMVLELGHGPMRCGAIALQGYLNAGSNKKVFVGLYRIDPSEFRASRWTARLAADGELTIPTAGVLTDVAVELSRDVVMDRRSALWLAAVTSNDSNVYLQGTMLGRSGIPPFALASQTSLPQTLEYGGGSAPLTRATVAGGIPCLTAYSLIGRRLFTG
jgi:hypothetical protein